MDIEDYTTSAEWFLVKPAGEEILWYPDEEPFDTLGAVFTVWYSVEDVESS